MAENSLRKDGQLHCKMTQAHGWLESESGDKVRQKTARTGRSLFLMDTSDMSRQPIAFA